MYFRLTLNDLLSLCMFLRALNHDGIINAFATLQVLICSALSS